VIAKETYNPEATRLELLNAAFMEMYVNGFQAASLSRILKNVNFTKGALYHHFPTKKDLGLSVVNEIIGKRMFDFFSQPLENTDSPIEALCSTFQKKADMLSLQEIKYGCPLNNLTQEMSAIDEDFYIALKKISDKWVETTASALEKGKKHGKVREEVDSQGAALLIVASIEGAFGLGKTTESSDAFRKCMDQLQNYVQSLEA